MKAVILWRRDSEYGRGVEEWIKEFEKNTSKRIESLSPDSFDGEEFARSYDIVEYPSIVCVDNSGAVLGFWKGLPLPSYSEVSQYVDF